MLGHLAGNNNLDQRWFVQICLMPRIAGIQHQRREFFEPLLFLHHATLWAELHFRRASASVSGMPLYLFSVSGYTLPEALVLY